MSLTFAIITDLHFGPEARHEGKLRKLTHHAGTLAEAFVRRMNHEVRPDLVVNLGDDIEDEDHALDLARYRACQNILRKTRSTLVNIAAKHDLVFMNREALDRIWKRSSPISYSFYPSTCHFTVP